MPRPVPVIVEVDLDASREDAFAIIAPIDLPTIFRRFGLIPGVRGTRDQTGAWDAAGQRRVVILEDGSEAREELQSYDAPRHFGYRVDAFTGPLRFVIAHADGTWWFTERGAGGSHVSWTYAFQPRSAALAPVVRLVLAPLWRAYASRALARGAAIVAATS